MRSTIFRKAGERLAIEDRPIPAPGPTEVVIKVGRCGICGSDFAMTSAESPFRFQEGCAPGHEYAGEIVAMGHGVQGFRMGDRVTAIPAAGCGRCEACLSGDPYGCPSCRYIMGGFSEYTVAEARHVAKLPAKLSLADGALVEPLACGAQAVRYAELSPGSRALVIGAGPIGLAVLYWARRSGCVDLAVCARSDRHKGLAEQMGARTFLPQGEDLGERAAQALGGAPDVVFECAGAPGLISAAIGAVRPRGSVVSCGMCFHPESIVSGVAAMKQVRLQFSVAYVMSDFRQAIDSLEAGHVEPRAMISETIGLSDLPETFEVLRGDRTHCKVMVDPAR